MKHDGSSKSVVLTNGEFGRVISIIHGESDIKTRIMNEGQTSENKENFGGKHMHDNSIPKAVQSFLNSDGGYLYVGVGDEGSLEERLVGLEYDFGLITQKTGNLSRDKLCDMLERRLMDSLEKYLSSEASLGSLVGVNFPTVLGIAIMEVKVERSSRPWFYRNLTRTDKPRQYEIWLDGKSVGRRSLDDFYIRRGGSKKLLHTHEEFYAYAKSRFSNI